MPNPTAPVDTSGFMIVGTTAGGDITGTYPSPTIAGKASVYASGGYFNFGYGLIVQWGIATGAGDSETVTFATTFPNACYSVVASPAQSATVGIINVNVYNVSVGSFDIFHTTGAHPSRWVAIGH